MAALPAAVVPRVGSRCEVVALGALVGFTWRGSVGTDGRRVEGSRSENNRLGDTGRNTDRPCGLDLRTCEAKGLLDG